MTIIKIRLVLRGIIDELYFIAAEMYIGKIRKRYLVKGLPAFGG